MVAPPVAGGVVSYPQQTGGQAPPAAVGPPQGYPPQGPPAQPYGAPPSQPAAGGNQTQQVTIPGEVSCRGGLFLGCLLIV